MAPTPFHPSNFCVQKTQPLTAKTNNNNNHELVINLCAVHRCAERLASTSKYFIFLVPFYSTTFIFIILHPITFIQSVFFLFWKNLLSSTFKTENKESFLSVIHILTMQLKGGKVNQLKWNPLYKISNSAWNKHEKTSGLGLALLNSFEGPSDDYFYVKTGKQMSTLLQIKNEVGFWREGHGVRVSVEEDPGRMAV
jgi:hypothetical protein